MNYQPKEEIYTFSITRSGIRRMMNIYFELGFCSYWDSFEQSWENTENGMKLKPFGYWLTDTTRLLEKEKIYQFRHSSAFPIGHCLKPNDFENRKLIRLVRDPRDMCISNYHRYKKLNQSKSYSQTDSLDMPLLIGHGSLFKLGPAEEWWLQEKMLELVKKDKPIHYVKFEDTQIDQLNSLEQLFKFTNYEFTRTHLETALLNSKRDLFGQVNHENAGGIENWKKSCYTEFINRVSLVVAEDNYLSYEIKSVPSKSNWPNKILETAATIWITQILSSNALYLKSYYIPQFSNVLRDLCNCNSNIPLLEFTLAKSLIEKNVHVSFAIDVLHNLASNSSSFIKMASNILLYLISKKNENYINNFKKLLIENINSEYHENLIIDTLTYLGFTGIKDIIKWSKS